jgi:hypothetical protein
MASLTAVIESRFVIASEAKQSPAGSLRRYAPRDDSSTVIASAAKQSTR